MENGLLLADRFLVETLFRAKWDLNSPKWNERQILPTKKVERRL